MLTKFREHKWLIAVIVMGLLAALWIDWERNKLETANNTVEMVIDYEDIVELAQTEGLPVADLMACFKEAGITSLSVYEMTLEKLTKAGKVTVFSGAQLAAQQQTGSLGDPYWRTLVESGKIHNEDVYITGNNRELLRDVESDLTHRLSRERVMSMEAPDGRMVLVVKANYEKVMKWNLGLSRDEMGETNAAGFNVVPRPTNYTKVSESDVKSVFERLEGIQNVTGFMFVGDESLGYPNNLKTTAALLKEKGISLYMIEHPLQLQFLRQEGLLDIATAMGYQAARVYVVPKDEQLKLKTNDLIPRWGTTDPDRNIRVNLLRKFDKPEPGENLVETNLRYVKGSRDAVLAEGFTLGRATIFPSYFPSKLLLAIAVAGAVAAGVLYLVLLFPLPRLAVWGLWALLTAGLAFPVLHGSGTLARQMAALSTAVIFPTLAVAWWLKRWPDMQEKSQGSLGNIIRQAFVGLLVATCISLLGGLYVGGLLADTRFFLEMEIFRGVKLTFVMPLLLITLLYLKQANVFHYDGKQSIFLQVKGLLEHPIYMKTLMLLGAAAVVIWVYVGRSGHTAGVPVPAIEIQLRHFLEKMLVVRPREKEFMIGHPAFFLAVMALYRQWPKVMQYGLLLFVTIGQGSMAETFAHMRTPVMISFLRGAEGWGLGVILGVLGIFGIWLMEQCWQRWQNGRRYA